MIKVDSVKIVEEAVPVYDIHVEEDRSFVVAGVVVHNSLICRSLDGRVFRLDDPDKPQFPLHFRERSVYTPVVDWEGLGLEPPKEGTRASADGQVPSSTSYGDWFRGQSKAEQNRIIGPARAQLFRDGKVDFRDMVAKDGRTLTLEELEAKG